MFCIKCGSQVLNGAMFCAKCGSRITADTGVVPIDTREIDVPRYKASELEQYLYNAKLLESNRYAFTAAKDRLQRIIDSLGHRKDFQKPTSDIWSPFYDFAYIFMWAAIVAVLLCAMVCGNGEDRFITNIFSIITVILLFSNEELLVGLLIALVGAVVATFAICGVRCAIEKLDLDKRYKIYQSQVAADNARVEQEKKKIQTLKGQQTILNNEIRKIDALRDQLYQLNVLHPKYRELVPVITMYEYFETGRCYALVGPNGAYNLYEQELRQNIIISNLNQVIVQLARIENTQRALCAAVKEANRYAEAMHDMAAGLQQTGRRIEQNAAITAKNAKIAADNSAVSAYINLCKF